MKSILKITLAVLFIVAGTTETHAQWGKKKVNGNGDITTKTVNTSDYNEVKVVGSMDVFLESGTEGSIKVTTDANIHEYLKIESSGGTLTIRIEKGVSIRTKKGIHIVVPFQDISEVSLTGSGDLVTRDTIKTANFSAQLTGSGDVELSVEANSVEAKLVGSGDVILKIDATRVEADLTGSGDFDLSGSTKEFDVGVHGSGDLEGASLRSDDTTVYVSGSGSATINASNNLKARVSGSGSIRYSGSPQSSDKKVSGSGSIRSID